MEMWDLNEEGRTNTCEVHNIVRRAYGHTRMKFGVQKTWVQLVLACAGGRGSLIFGILWYLLHSVTFVYLLFNPPQTHYYDFALQSQK